jgi:hypothetical protein
VLGIIGLSVIKFIAMEKSIAKIGAISTRVFGWFSAQLLDVTIAVKNLTEGFGKLFDGDFKGAGESFKKVFTTELSPEAQAIMEIAEQTAKMQEAYADSLPDYMTLSKYAKLFGGMLTGEKSTKELLKEAKLSAEDVKQELKNQKDLISEKSLLQSLGGVVKGSGQLKDYLVTKSINNTISGFKSGTANLKADIAAKNLQKEKEKEATGNVKDKRQELLDKSVQKSTGTPAQVPSNNNDATKPDDQTQQIIDFLGGSLGGQILGMA